MTFIEFKKCLLDAETSIPKFCKLIKVSEKNIQSYKKKDHIPNAIAVAAACFAKMHNLGIDYKIFIDQLGLVIKTKPGVGFAKKKEFEK
ncbi:hypothetical protein [Arcobacter arenosus]|jgi:hypothetical protein|uniref:Uncharacterized protein n=1 Tax=Arcobacter arenosus TaxID=2576037 RepID=A0A5R8XYE2_9BACT|nr:hypothetical protein [Arcobacter arenosus]TLP36246.1 hypothetical protein FDK22_13335 [Arcobacter arenosus]